jgi:hypothetical protein
MSAKDAEIEVKVDDETLWHALIRAKTLRDDADRRLEDVEATQFERAITEFQIFGGVERLMRTPLAAALSRSARF